LVSTSSAGIATRTGAATSTGSAGSDGLGEADGVGDVEGVADTVGLGVGDAEYVGRLPTDSTATSSATCQRVAPRYSTTATMTPRLAQKITRADRDLFTAES
jgi:hypothetical protein